MSTGLHSDDSVCWLAVRVPDYTGGHRRCLRAGCPDCGCGLGAPAQDCAALSLTEAGATEQQLGALAQEYARGTRCRPLTAVISCGNDDPNLGLGVRGMGCPRPGPGSLCGESRPQSL